MAATPERIILASASAARAALLRAAGIDFAIEPAEIDEAHLKLEARRRGEGSIPCAVNLAAAKACAVSSHYPDALVIGADQILTAGDQWFDKPGNLAEARAQLQFLRHIREHTLVTAVCVASSGVSLWHSWRVPRLTMRRFSDAFLDAYIAAVGESLLGSVGAYRLEGHGVQFFARTTGDYFSVLGLPLIELLHFLRLRGALPR